MKYRIILTDICFSDLTAIKTFYDAVMPGCGSDRIGKILESLESLKEFPLLGKVIENPTFDYAECRTLVCDGYLAVYRTNDFVKCIYVLRVLSHYQNWKKALEGHLLKKEKTQTHKETTGRAERSANSERK